MDTKAEPHEAPPEPDVTLGAGVRISVLRCRPSDAVDRRPGRIAPGTWPLMLVSGGPLMVEQGHAGTRLEAGDLALLAPSGTMAVTASGNLPARATVLSLPQPALPIPQHTLRRLVARPVPSTTGPGALLAHFMEGVADQAAALRSAPLERLGSAAADLAVAFISGLAAPPERAPQQSGEAALLETLTAYIGEHLADPDLSPRKLAAAHHVSVRYVHHAFHREQWTACRYIRERRLERCRADLTDPALADMNIGRIRARWGFKDDAVFGRAFKRSYGVAPGELRRNHLGG